MKTTHSCREHKHGGRHLAPSISSEMWGEQLPHIIKFYSTPPKESNKKLIHIRHCPALLPDAI